MHFSHISSLHFRVNSANPHGY